MLDNLFGEKLCGPYGSCLAFAIDLKIEKYKKKIQSNLKITITITNKPKKNTRKS